MNEYQKKWARRDRVEKRGELYGTEMRGVVLPHEGAVYLAGLVMAVVVTVNH